MIIIDSIETSLSLICHQFEPTTTYHKGTIYQMNPQLGTGYIKFYGQLQEVYYFEAKVIFNKAHYRQFAITEQYIEFSNNLQQNFTLGQHVDDILKAEKGLNCYVNTGKGQLIQHFSKDTTLHFNALVIRSSFLERLSTIDEKELIKLSHLIQTGGFSDSRLQLIFEQLKLFTLTSEHGRTYLIGKAYESIALLQDKLNSMSWTSKLLTNFDVNLVKKVLDYINNNSHLALPISELTRIFSINKNKLQTGFQVLTGLSIHEYHVQIRVQYAMILLQETSKK